MTKEFDTLIDFTEVVLELELLERRMRITNLIDALLNQGILRL